MINKKDIYADLRVHTLFSLHAYSTVKECIDESVKNGIQFLAITDHFYADGTALNQKNEISRLTHIADRINKTIDPVCIIDGTEFNVGQDIIEWGKLSRLKWKLYGVHGWFINKKDISLDNLKSLYSKAGCKFNAWAHIERTS